MGKGKSWESSQLKKKTYEGRNNNICMCIAIFTLQSIFTNLLKHQRSSLYKQEVDAQRD